MSINAKNLVSKAFSLFQRPQGSVRNTTQSSETNADARAVPDVIRESLSAALDLSPTEVQSISRDTTSEHFDQWDSVNHIKLILELERRLDVKFIPEDAVDMGSIDAIIKTLDKSL